jgi:hypothetical protein
MLARHMWVAMGEQAGLYLILQGLRQGIPHLPADSPWLPVMRELRTVLTAQAPDPPPAPQRLGSSAPTGRGS